ncbi:hypothetical protein A9977_10490 [Variovorax sp. UMC13]|nr:hypothetical protein [Variovorax sp. UMC13]
MITARSTQAIRGYTFSIRTLRGRLIVHVEKEALLQLGASEGDDSTLLQTLSENLTYLHAVALQLAAGGLKSEVTVGALDIGRQGAQDVPPRLRHMRAP